MAFKFFSHGSMKGEKVVGKTTLLANLSISSIPLLLMRFFQIIMAIVVIGLYAQDLDNAHRAGVGYDKNWMYATVVGTLGAFYAILCMTPFFKAWYFFIGDFLLFILYTAAFGIFCKMYRNEDPEGNKGIIRMKRAFWFLLVNMILWFLTACYGAFIFATSRKARTQHTGRAQSHV